MNLDRLDGAIIKILIVRDRIRNNETIPSNYAQSEDLLNQALDTLDFIKGFYESKQ